MEKEKPLLEMDFGEMYEYGGQPTDIVSSESEDSPQGDEEIKKPSKDGDDTELDLHKVLEDGGVGGEEEEKEKVVSTKKDDVESSDKGSPGSGSTKKSKEKEDNSGVPFTLVFARYQLEQGNLTELNEEEVLKIVEDEGEAAAMSYLFQQEVELNRQAYLKQYEEDATELKEYIELKDAGADPNTAKQLVGSLAEYDKISPDDLDDEEKEDLRRAIMTQNYKNSTRFSDVKIKKLVDQAVSLGEDIEESKEALESVKGYNREAIKAEKTRLDQEAEAFQRQHREQITKIKDTISSLDEVLPGHKINKQTKQKIEEFLLKPAGEDANGNKVNKVWQKRLENPLDFDIKLAYLLHTGYFDGKTDKLEKASKTKMLGELEKYIESSGQTFKGKPAVRRDDDEDATDSIDAMRKAFGM